MLLVDNRSSTDPYFNLALEEYLVRNTDIEETLLLLYFNADCIVLGKNQNIWKEANILFARQNFIDIARRITGGGTVYHDSGNLNFSLITKFEQKDLNKFDTLLNPVVAALSKYGIEAKINDKNDLEVDGFKITGTAQFTNRKKIISHGTLLIDSDIPKLKSALKPQFDEISSRAIDSKRSTVKNVSEIENGIVKENLASEIRAAYNAEVEYRMSESEFQKVVNLRDQKYKSFEWLYAKSSDCTILHKLSEEGHMLELTIADGHITEYKIRSGEQVVEHKKCNLAVNSEFLDVKDGALQQIRSMLY
ncbi:MAG: lipoate--protein ligase [Chitinophagales bacterium]|nr:lipoate--protein ligase [Chitinophagales bacterium]